MLIAISIFFLVLLIFFSAFLSGSETAMFSLPKFSVRSYRDSDDKRKRLIANLLKNPRELLVTIIMLNVLANILVQNTVSSLFTSVTSWSLKVGVPLILTLVFGEIVPKSIALPYHYSVSYRVAPFLNFAASALGPIRTKLTKITGYVSHFLFFFLKKEKDISASELEHVLKTSHEKGVLQVDETELAGGYLELQDSTVKEHMRPRDEVLFFDINDSLDQLVHILVDQKCSRVPVCDKDLDNVLGIASAKRLFFSHENIKETEDLKKVLKKPFFVPESMNAWTLLIKLREQKEAMALVVDEYGSISGLITQEDMVESIVGEITDLRDQKNRYTRSSENVIIASGKLELAEFQEIFDVELENEANVVTIGGWLTNQLGDIPQTGAKYIKNNFLFYVLAADPNRIRRIYIRRIKPK